jgi:hypothetical protein
VYFVEGTCLMVIKPDPSIYLHSFIVYANHIHFTYILFIHCLFVSVCRVSHLSSFELEPPETEFYQWSDLVRTGEFTEFTPNTFYFL